MNLAPSAPPSERPRALRRRKSGTQAHTLPELMTAMAIFSMAMVAMFGAQFFNLQVNFLTRSKLGASDDSRSAIGRMVNEVRSAGAVRVGTGNATSFVEAQFGELQQGNALQVHPVKSRNDLWVRYFWDARDGQLKRMENDGGAVAVVARAISNTNLFTSEDSQGNILANSYNNRVIGVTLQFHQLQTPLVNIGHGELYDFYQMRTKITRRALE
jgi:hypothetical protein